VFTTEPANVSGLKLGQLRSPASRMAPLVLSLSLHPVIIPALSPKPRRVLAGLLLCEHSSTHRHMHGHTPLEDAGVRGYGSHPTSSHPPCGWIAGEGGDARSDKKMGQAIFISPPGGPDRSLLASELQES
jgi:hypothetical protein